jgi:hypothetical protein
MLTAQIRMKTCTLIFAIGMLMASCGMKPDIDGKYKNETGDELQFLHDGSFLVSKPGQAMMGHWRWGSDDELVADLSVLGTTVPLMGCVRDGVILLKSNGGYVRYFREKGDGSFEVVPVVTEDSNVHSTLGAALGDKPSVTHTTNASCG